MSNDKAVWTEEEDQYIENNYMGLSTVAGIAEAINRSEQSVVRRLRVLIAPTDLQKTLKIRECCEKHAKDLEKSGGRWT